MKKLALTLFAAAALVVSAAAVPVLHPVIGAIFLLGTFGAVYFGATIAAGVPEARGAAARLLRR